MMYRRETTLSNILFTPWTSPEDLQNFVATKVAFQDLQDCNYANGLLSRTSLGKDVDICFLEHDLSLEQRKPSLYCSRVMRDYRYCLSPACDFRAHSAATLEHF